MKLPIEPLSVLDKLPVQPSDVRQADPVTAARAIGPDRPGVPYGAPSPRRRPGAEGDAQGDVSAYSGEERRKGERRVDSKPAMLDTRVRRDRRRQSRDAGVDLKV